VQRFNEVRQLATTFLFELHDAIEKLPGSTPARALLVQRALTSLDSLAQEAGDDPSLQRELAMAYAKVGYVQWHRYYANLGDTAGALASQRKALAIQQALVAADPTDVGVRRDLARSSMWVGDALAATGDVSGALEHYRLALATREGLAAADPTNAQDRHDAAISYQRLGDTLGNPGYPNVGNPLGALASYHKMLATLEALAAEAPTNAAAQHALSIGYEKIGDMLPVLGDTAGALASQRKALAIRQALAAADPTNAQLRRDLAVGYRKVGLMLAATGDEAGALEQYREALAIREALTAADPTNAAARRDLARIYGDIGQVQRAMRDVASALESLRTSLALFEALAATDATNMDLRTSVSQTLRRLAELSAQAGHLDEARSYTGRLFALQQGQAEQATATAAEVHAFARTLLTCVPADLQDPAAALRYAQQAVTMTHGQDATLLGTLALASHRTGDQARAIATVEQALALAPGDAIQRQELEAQLATCATALQRVPER